MKVGIFKNELNKSTQLVDLFISKIQLCSTIIHTEPLLNQETNDVFIKFSLELCRTIQLIVE